VEALTTVVTAVGYETLGPRWQEVLLIQMKQPG
jgi:hypothetical protein